MDLNRFELNDLLLAAIKSEMESNELYSKMAKKTKNDLLSGKLIFLAREEIKHRAFIEDIYRNHYPDKDLKIPSETPVPLPKVKMDEDTSLSNLLKQAMVAEQAASDFYKHLAGRFEAGSKINNTLMYFADMEIGHYKILDVEKNSMERYEEDDVYWPMIHAGP
ncbi:MAG TPA: Rubrerythrin [Bacteroidetes bacterium]|nr:Rubrerythrin [Bacteroidota bacterium]